MARTPRPWYRRQDGWWYVQYLGKQHRLVKGRENRQEAKRKCHELLASSPLAPPADPPATEGLIEGSEERRTFREVAEAYLRFAEGTHYYAPRTLLDVRRTLRQASDALGGRPVAGLIPHDLSTWIHTRFPHEDTSPNYRSLVVQTVKRALNWAVREGLLPRNPFKGVTLGERLRRGRVMADGDFRALLRHSPPSLRRPLLFLRVTGARPCEARSLTWGDVFLDQRVCVLQNHKTAKKTGAPRVIALPPVAVRLLAFLRGRRREGDDSRSHVFLTHLGAPWVYQGLANAVLRVRAAAGITARVTLYGLRHAFATRGILNGVGIRQVADLLGHTTVKTTEGYLHTAGLYDHLAEVVARAADLSRKL